MLWDYRLLAHEESGEIIFKIHVVHYDIYFKPIDYTKNSPSLSSENLNDLDLQLKRMNESVKKPILWSGDKFPRKFEEKDNRK